MIKSLLFSSILAFSFGSSLLNDKAPFHEPLKQNEEEQFKYYDDYIDLNFFSGVTFEFVSVSSNTINFFRIKGNVSNDKLVSTGVYDNDFKYFTPVFYMPNYGVDISTAVYNPEDNITMHFSNVRLTEHVDKYGFSLVTDFYDDDDFYYSIIPNSWLNFKVADTLTNDGFEITIIIPYGNYTQPPADYVNTLKNNLRFFNQNYYDKYLLGAAAGAYDQGYTDGSNKGFGDGYVDGYNDGLTDGHQDAYNQGYNAGVAADFNAYSWLTGIFSAMGGLLSIQLLPNVSIGGILILIMVLTLLPFLIGLLKGGKG